MFAENYKKLAENNTNFRSVLYTGVHSQLVAMSIAVGDDIGEEVHEHVDQVLMLVKGMGEAVINGEKKKVTQDSIIYVPAGAMHNLINTGNEALKLLTLYSPPEHPDKTVHKTKLDANES